MILTAITLFSKPFTMFERLLGCCSKSLVWSFLKFPFVLWTWLCCWNPTSLWHDEAFVSPVLGMPSMSAACSSGLEDFFFSETIHCWFLMYFFFHFLAQDFVVDRNMWVNGAITSWGFDKLIYWESNPKTAGTDGLGRNNNNFSLNSRTNH